MTKDTIEYSSFVNYANSRRRECFGCFGSCAFYLCITITIIMTYIIISSIFIYMFGGGISKHIDLSNQRKYTNHRNSNMMINNNHCDIEHLAYLTNKCLQQNILEGKINNRQKSLEEKECIRHLKSDPRLVALMSAYIDMVHGYICLDPQYAQQRSIDWFNRPVYYSSQPKIPSQ